MKELAQNAEDAGAARFLFMQSMREDLAIWARKKPRNQQRGAADLMQDNGAQFIRRIEEAEWRARWALGARAFARR